MELDTTCILLNAGTRTRRAFIEGLGPLKTEHYQTKRMILHITHDGEPRFIYKNIPINLKKACVFTRLRSTDQQFCGILYDYFSHHHIPASDPINHSYVQSAEKISQMLTLTLAGIRVPETIIFREESFAHNRTYIEEHMAFPLIYKTDGSQGKNVHLIESSKELNAMVAQKKQHTLALIQPFIENTFDTRTIVAFGEILGTIQRSRVNGYLNNIAQGAVASAYELTEAETHIAIQSAAVCGIDVAGVDIIHSDTGPVVLEVNKSPQINGFESVHPFKVFTKVAESMLRKLKN
jgi:ribosomal protein S6--L-glutamate ligase